MIFKKICHQVTIYFVNITYSYRIVLCGTLLNTYSSALYIKRKHLVRYTQLIHCVVDNNYVYDYLNVLWSIRYYILKTPFCHCYLKANMVNIWPE